MNYRYFDKLKFDKEDADQLFYVTKGVSFFKNQAFNNFLIKTDNTKGFWWDMQTAKARFGNAEFDMEFICIVDNDVWYTPMAEPDIPDKQKQIGLNVAKYFGWANKFNVKPSGFYNENGFPEDPIKAMKLMTAPMLDDLLLICSAFSGESGIVFKSQEPNYDIYFFIKLPADIYPDWTVGELIDFFAADNFNGTKEEFGLVVKSLLFFLEWNVVETDNEIVATKGSQGLVYKYNAEAQKWQNG
ncbi:MAG: hypothetical protein FWE53_04470 [Firmicutes bacterium]|nr:hypothetical protein [Bacillota bacterium]